MKKYRLILVISGVLFLSVLFFIYIIYKSSEKQLFIEFNNHQQYITDDISTTFADRVNIIVNYAKYIYKNENPNDFIELTRNDEIFRKSFQPYIESIAYYNELGTLVKSSNNNSLPDKIDPKIIKDYLKSGLNYFIDDEKNFNNEKSEISNFIVYIPLNYSVSQRKSKVSAAYIFVAYKINADNFFNFNRIQSHLKKNIYSLWIIDNEGNVLFQSDHPQMETRKVGSMTGNCMNCHVDKSYLKIIEANKNGTVQYVLKGHREKTASFSTIKLNNEKWKIVVSTPNENIISYLNNAGFNTILLLSAVIILLIIVAFYLIKFYRTQIKIKEDLKYSNEKKNLLEKIVESEERFEEFSENAAMGIFIVQDNRFKYVNPIIIKITGYSEKELLNMNFWELVHPNDREMVKERGIQRLRGNSLPNEYEFKILTPDGKQVDIEYRGNIINYEGKAAILGNAIDITERKKTEASLYLFNVLINQLNDSIEIIDPETGKFIDVNENAWKSLGYSREEILSKKIFDIDRELDPKRFFSPDSGVKKSGSLVAQRFHYRKDGSRFPVETNVKLIRFERDYIVAVSRDVTERNKAEYALKESEERFHNMFSQHSAVMLLIEPLSGEIIEANNAAEKFYGYSLDQLSKMKVQDINILEPEVVSSKRMEAFSYKTNYFVFQHRLANGNVRSVEVHSSPIMLNSKKVLFSIIHDITERQYAEDQLRKISLAIEQSPVSIVITDLDAKIEYVNPRFCELTGYGREEVIGKNPNILKSGHTSKEEYKIMWENISAGKEWRGEFLDKMKNGTLIWESATISPIFNSSGKITHYLAVKEDITQRKNSIELLKQSESKFRYLAEQSPNMIFINYKGKVVYVNQKCVELLGYSREEFYNNNFNFISLIEAEKREQVLKNYEAHQKGEDVTYFEYNLLTKSGEKVSAILYTELIDYEDGQAIMGTAVDITERNKNEQLILNSEIEFRSVWENSKDAMRLCNEDGIIIRVNKAFCNLFEKTENECVGQIFQVVYKPVENASNIFRENVKNKKYIGKQETEIELWNGRKLWVDVSNSLIEINNSRLVLSIYRDISERKAYEIELKAAKEKAEEMNRLKSSFLANMSHELRTPMIGILGFSELLKDDIKNQYHKDMASTIYSSGKRLLETLNLLLDLARLESNKQEILFKKVNIGQLIKEVLKNFEGFAISKNLYIKTIIKENIYSNLDERIFIQIVNNLVNNALKFTDHGGIFIEVNSEMSSNSSWSIIKIEDTGIGIPKASLDIIFEEFRQVSEGYNRHFEGTGLGLTLTKKSVELMNGNISVESKLGKGSTFMVKFPLVEQEIKNTEKTGKQTESPFKERTSMKILVVDNDEVSLNYLNYVLNKYFTVHTTGDGAGAIKLASENKYDLILMDIGLGIGMNGMEATQEIRKISGYKKIPVVAVTGFAMKNDKQEFLSQGLTHYISKPFTKFELLKLIKKIVGDKN